ncbi:fumarylacetoacetate hydrolase family protein [Halomarina oriensis]|uniref:2-hydroxyhepta-2,4-diene-1,7-dioate isomerase n=1 Tax=Halomarina oriensis TaxID=671145 RepID=A0A6B0GLC4_9EURY|nr:fumarylacetoacetate hydrolase family protein [Halomarina oriensis]MWG35726.1 2-hydroxyhepta-2,4-diene-1,7-dioate isomerase [Halomarina oriensis]
MRLARFRDSTGNVHRGELHGDLDDEAELTADGETFDPAAVELLAPCEPSKFVCVGRNYADHAAEMDNDVPDRPLLFLKPPNSVAAHGETVTLPSGKERLDHEAELAVVVGERAKGVSADDAMEYVEGFTCLNDLSNRDDQNREQNWVRGKAFDQSAPVGPVVATPDEVPDDAFVRARVNGETRQDGSRDQFVFSVPDLVEEITTYLTLEPGDVVATGTPAGVGPLEDGDVVEIEVEGVGTLENEVRIP